MSQSNPYVVGLTGGISTGKSTVAKMLKEDGFTVIDYDEISREIMSKEGALIESIRTEFGEEFILDGAVDRRKLGALVFSDETKRNLLNSITHDKIIDVSIKLMSELSGIKIVFLEIPLLFEVRQKLESKGIIFDEIWLVSSSLEIQLKRLMERDHIDRKYAKEKISSQMPLVQKESLSDVVIKNNDNIHALNEAVKTEVEHLLERINK